MSAVPFIKWVGGKRQLLPQLLYTVANTRWREGGAYFEPFVGGAALYYALIASRTLKGAATLGDVNVDLINAYTMVRDHVILLVESLSSAAFKYDETLYYRARATFNAAMYVPAVWRTSLRDNVEHAARFIYLNRTGFNGLYRVNGKGEFNVPFGRYTNPTICDEANLYACAEALHGVTLVADGFAQTSAKARKGDLVYFDPPYWPVSSTGDFTTYAKGGFDADEQARLADWASQLRGKGVKVILSNADVPPVRKLYKGWNIERVEARRNVNSKAAGRGKVGEVIITG